MFVICPAHLKVPKRVLTCATKTLHELEFFFIFDLVQSALDSDLAM